MSFTSQFSFLFSCVFFQNDIFQKFHDTQRYCEQRKNTFLMTLCMFNLHYNTLMWYIKNITPYIITYEDAHVKNLHLFASKQCYK